MSSAVEAASMQTLSQIVEALGPINENTFDKWSGKRNSRRRDVLLPVRLRLLGESENPRSPAFTARSRDISDEGLGLTIPCKLEPRQPFAVEVFTDMGTWMGRMQLIHCTQTIGGYKVGLRCAPAEAPAVPAESAEAGQFGDEDGQSDELSVAQAQAEVRQALRRYQLAEVTWGLFGVQMEREIKRILDSLPPPLESRLKLEPRRSDYRREVDGEVHVLVSSDGGQKLLTTRIADLSAGGARLMLAPDQAEQWRSGSAAAIGIWTANNGTLWVPARIVHGGSPLIEDKSVGLQFVREGASVQDFR